PHVRHDDATLHLFARVEGEPGARWLDGETGAARATAAMTALAHLHRALGRLPIDDGLVKEAAVEGGRAGTTSRSEGTRDPWVHVRARLERIRAGRLDGLPAGAVDVLDTAERTLDVPAPGPVQWLHGDFHLGNLLWRRDEVIGVVDFDDVGIGAVGGEVALALFALARRPGERFRYDPTLWRVGLAAYAGAESMSTLDASVGSASSAVAASITTLDQPALARVFCASQLLVHLEAAQRGLWALDDPGLELAFWPYWHALSERDLELVE
nr:aminoglycoside phosphotransferase family protein [Deltaproteobacteria bacterium]